MKQEKFLKLLLVVSFLTLLGSACGVNITSGDGGGVYLSTDAGTSWQVKSFIREEKNKSISLVGSTVKQLVFSLAQPNTAYAVVTGGKLTGLFKTTDNGEHWQQLIIGSVNSVAAHPSDGGTIYALAGNRVVRSTDGGANWSIVYLETTADVVLNQVAIDNATPDNIYIVSSKGILLRSQDKGVSWQQVHFFVGGLAQVAVRSGIIYAAQPAGKIWLSRDLGSTWQDLTPNLRKVIKGNIGDFHTMSLLPDSTVGLLYVSQYGIIRTLDSGSSWQVLKLVTQPGVSTITALGVGPVSANYIYYTTDKAFYRSTDGGATWETMVLPVAKIPLTLALSPTSIGSLLIGFKQ